jgi:hypothetical protein
MTVGYASVDDQSLDAQCETVTAAGATKIFEETVSGAARSAQYSR